MFDLQKISEEFISVATKEKRKEKWSFVQKSPTKTRSID